MFHRRMLPARPSGHRNECVVFLRVDDVPLNLIQNHSDVFENLTEIRATGSGGRLESIVAPESSAC